MWFTWPAPLGGEKSARLGRKFSQQKGIETIYGDGSEPLLLESWFIYGDYTTWFTGIILPGLLGLIAIGDFTTWFTGDYDKP